ncbi:TIGR03013 family XrtA/PEP-CTERM system glycosyltransferase [Nitratidesulfovibrio sp.]|uniref:TIGR03013 family XrtA/PEP-CTERM system glycosyltransferase n=1 Tax=Nitratidesulfovibrio sp. TaxID=2802297 RepID=UPI00334001F3
MLDAPVMRLLRDSVWLLLALGFGLVPAFASFGIRGIPPAPDMLVLAAVVLLCVHGVERLDPPAAREAGLFRTAAAVLAASVVLYALNVGQGVLFRHETQGLAVLVWFALLRGACIVLSGYWRFFPSLAPGVLVLGSGEGLRAMRQLVASTDGRYRLKGVIPCASEERAGAWAGRCGPVDPAAALDAAMRAALAGDGLVAVVRREKVRIIVVCLAERRGTFPVDAVLRCRMAGVEVLDSSSFYERVTRKLYIENMTPSWLIFAPGFRISRWRNAMKRLADIVLALLALAVVGPFLPLVALAVRLESAGPVFFRQVRVGRGGREFVIFKFRTMRDGAERDTGPVWARIGDSRVTPLGAMLRRFRIDELAQLANVLRGDMSFIGPRPERPEFVEGLSRDIPFYSERHAVKPGLTGWAQVRYPYGASREDALEKLRYDLYYIKNGSWKLDVEILFRTLGVILLGYGAR